MKPATLQKKFNKRMAARKVKGYVIHAIGWNGANKKQACAFSGPVLKISRKKKVKIGKMHGQVST